jgi:hypothetical protein
MVDQGLIGRDALAHATMGAIHLANAVVEREKRASPLRRSARMMISAMGYRLCNLR